MLRRVVLMVCGLAALSAPAGCTPAPDATQAAVKPQYLGIDTLLLDGDLVDFRVAMANATSQDQIEAYAACAAAQYALIRGYGFARHLRTTGAQEGGVWRADAVYTISASLPKGVRTIDAEVTVRDCGEQGIPTV